MPFQNPNQGQQPNQPNPSNEDLSFQVMPGESGSSGTSQMSQMSNMPSEPHHSNHSGNAKVIFGIVAVLILGGLAALAYFMLAGEKEDDKAVQSQLPKVFLKQHFDVEACKDQDVCGDNADPDNDGLSNYGEFKVRGSSDPNDPDSDKDGLADGDEVNIFKTEPMQKFSFCKQGQGGLACEYDDGSQLANFYEPSTPGQKMVDAKKQQVIQDIAKYKLHEPSFKTLKGAFTVSQNPTPTPTSQIVTTSEITVNIQNDKFVPANITINKGDTVIWVNKDQVNHYVVTDPHPQHTGLPGFDSAPFSSSKTYRYTFNQVGTFPYHDHLMPQAVGTVTVK